MTQSQSDALEHLRTNLRLNKKSSNVFGAGTSGFENLVGTDFEGTGHFAGLNVFHVTSRHCKRILQVKEGEEYSCVLFSQDCYLLLLTEEKDETMRRKSLSGGSPYLWKIYMWKGPRAPLKAKGNTGTQATLLKNKLIENGNFHDSKTIGLRPDDDEEKLLALFPGIKLEHGKHPEIEEKAAEGEGKASTTVKLYEVSLDKIIRVAVNRASIDQLKSYILDTGTDVYVFTGHLCKSIIQMRYTEEMARRRCRVDYKGSLMPKYVDETLNEEFREHLKNKSEEVFEVSNCQSPELMEYDPSQNTLVELDIDKDNIDELYDGALLEAHKIFVLDCYSEIFIWVGRKSEHVDLNNVRKLVQELSIEQDRPECFEILEIRERMEPVYFKERFFGLNDRESLEIHGYFDNTLRRPRKAERRVSQEISRVFQFLQEETLNQRDVIFADETAALRGYQILESGDVRSLPESRYGLFISSDMYVYVLSTKNGSRHDFYTWEGNEASIRARTVAGILTSGGIDNSELSGDLEGAKHHHYILEGNEPRELVFILEKLGHSIMLKKGILGRGYGRSKKRIKEPGLKDEFGNTLYSYEISSHVLDVPRLSEVPIETLLENGLHPSLSYIFIKEDANKKSSTLYYHNGEASNQKNLAFVEILLTSEASKLTKTSIKKKLDMSEENILHFIKPKMPYFLKAITRPIRLYELSYPHKSVGGSFIRDIGQGVFTQRDLSRQATCILDTGSDKIYLWFNSPKSIDETEFALDCFVKYIYQGLRNELKIMLEAISPELVDCGYEPAEFRVCFNGWINFEKAKKRYAAGALPLFEEKLSLAEMSPEERLSLQLDKENSLKGSLKSKSSKSTLGRAVKSLKRGKLMKYKRADMIGIKAKMGDKITIEEDGSIKFHGRPLKVLQKKISVDEVCKEFHQKQNVDWALWKYCSNNELDYVGHGEGGLKSFLEAIQEVQVYYGVVKWEKDGMRRVIFIIYRPEMVKPMLKNLVNNHKGVVQEMLGPTFAAATVSEKEDLTFSYLNKITSRAQT